MDAPANHFGHVLDEALSLSDDARMLLVDLLTESLEEVDVAAIAAAWDAESLRRYEEIESGEVQAIPWAEAKARLLAL